MYQLFSFGQDSTRTLKEVVVKQQVSDLQYSPNKKIYQISGNITTIGGNLLDALANIPSIYINPDGLIQYRGNQNMTIYFDGRPSVTDSLNKYIFYINSYTFRLL
jgi:hypothetical protein